MLLLIIGLYIFIQTPFGQNWIIGQVTKRLSKDLQTKVSIQHVDFALFNSMHLEGVLIQDRQQDTLLYAGLVNVRITDWFFLKKQATLKYIGLENAIVKFQRTDSVWRQQFIFDYFSSPSTGTKKKKAGIQFDLKKLELKNVKFLKKDQWLGEDMLLQVGSLQLDANGLSLSNNNYDIKSLVLKDPVFFQNGYAGIKPKDTTQRADLLSPAEILTPVRDSLFSWNKGGMDVRIASLKIENGTFRADKQTNRDPYAYFDGQHILFTDINTEISNGRFSGDTIFSKLVLTAKERSGLEIKSLSADLKLMPTGMAFNNLDLQTNRSTLRNFFMMSYDDMSDMGDFIHKVRMAANFEGSFIDSDDLAFFAPNMSSWKKKIALKGKIRGTVDDLVGRDLLVQAGASTLLNGDISLTGLPDINQTFIDFKANDFRTTYSDAVTIIPALRKVTSPDLRKIQYVRFTGSFTGFIEDFVTFGTLQTNLGVVKSDLNMKLPKGAPPVYSGNISTDNFQLGTFLGDPQIGAISLEGVVKGRGFVKNRNIEVKGKVRYVDFKNYRYHNIVIERGKLDNNLFDGAVAVTDENAEFTLNGIIDFNKKTPVFNFLADVKKANLKNLNLTKDDIAFNGHFNLDFAGNNIDNFLGNARITGASLTKDGNRLPFDSLVLSSSYVDSIKTLTASSNEFTGTIKGDFNIEELPDAVQLFLNKYYPAYIKPPRKMPTNESFQFDLTTQFVEDYVKLIDSSLTGFNYSHIKGSLDLRANRLDMDADIPYFKYGKQDFNDVKITARGNLDSLSLVGEARNIYINDSINIPLTVFRINSSNDASRVNISTGANQTVDKANINALVRTYNDGVKIEFDPSDFVINGKTWTIDESGELQFRSNTPASGQLVLKEGEQEIRLKTVPSSEGSWNDLLVDINKLNLGDISPYLMPKNRLEGILSGNIKVEDPTRNLRITSNNLQTQYLRLDNDSLGEIKAAVVYDGKTKALKVNGNTLNQENYLDFKADLFFGDKEQQKNNLIALKPRNFQLKILERFLGNLFSDIQGYLTGDVNIAGAFDNINVTGKAKLKDAGMKINFTQCFYTIDDTEIELKPTEINLDGLVLKDPVSGNPIYVEGRIEHNSFRNMFFQIDVATRKKFTSGAASNKPVLLLNTTYNDNKQFFGKVMGTGSFSLAGPQSEMIMAISAIASDQDSSYITIPSSKSRESGIADFLVEKKYGREMSDSGLAGNASNIIYDVDITANPMVNVKVVLDDLTGDEIKGRGAGTLNIHSGTSEPLKIRGRYEIEEGSYLFTFQSFFKKPFELKKGGDNFIEWTDDPYKAQIHFDAVYTAERVSFAPLASLSVQNDNISRARGDVYVIATLTDELFKPTINFKLDFPISSPAVTDPSLSFALQQLTQNTNEINTQVTYLIVFNSFAPPQGSSGAGLNISEIATNTISGIFLDVINGQLNKILGKLLNNDKYSINLNTSIYNRNIISDSKTALNLGSNVNFSIGRSFFNDRFIITAGGGFDAPLQQSNIQQSIQLLPDVTMEWLINPTGTLRASFFYRENADYLTNTASGGPGRARRYGGSLTYKKEFNTLGDLFRRRKKQPPAPVDSIGTTVPEAIKTEEQIKRKGER